MPRISLRVNGKAVAVDVDDPNIPLLYVLTDDLRLNGPKYGCGVAQCGSCTVLMDGLPIRSCVTPVSRAKGAITTIEGLGTVDKPHPIQQAFIDEQAIQCGYCVSGVMLYGKAYIDRNPGATDDQIANALTGLICRCHAHFRILKALRRYANGVAGR